MFAYPRGAPHECGRVRTYLFRGFRMESFMYGIQVCLHASVFLFFWAISDFFCTVYHPFGLVTRYTLVAVAIFYFILSISPIVFSNSPYGTPMTPPLRAAGIILRIIIRSPSLCHQWYHSQIFDLTGLPYYKGIHFDRARLYLIKAEVWARALEPYAMAWLFTYSDISGADMDKFLEGLPGYMSSSHTRKGPLGQYLTADHILIRIKEHFMTCATSMELFDDASIARVLSCVKALLRIFKYSRESKEYSPDKIKELQLQQKYIQTLIDDFQTLCRMDDPLIALRASCIRAFAVQGLLSQFVPSDSTTGGQNFPVIIIPIYTFFFPNDNTGTIRQLDDGHPPREEEIKKIWKSLLYDGPLANLTTLAQAIRNREHASQSTLSFCWKALDILLMQLGTIHSGEPTRAQWDFENLHENIRAYVHADERGFRIKPLLDILDIVARGRRLSMVFSGHPKYRNRADIVFGKEHLRNGDLLEAFAHCLPDFISINSPEICRSFMEKVVRHDDLWTSLQDNLWNTERSDSPAPDKLRIFKDCCTVLDLAFSILEDSREVDWRAPEFGSLSQHFDSFIMLFSKGAFIGRATSFRVGVIRARFCNALLTQFRNDLEREGTVSFRSQWDVASLSRLINILGLRDDEDAEFWNTYIDGGHIGVEFTAKALEMIDIAVRDGPLLIFCRLGHLAATATPLHQSGLDLKDIKKLYTLQKKAIKNTRLPLSHASDAVWDGLDQLREKVRDLCGKYNGKDRKNLRRLLRKIEDVWNLRSSGADGPSQSEPAEEQGPNTSVAVDSASSPESRGISNQFSFVSGSTAVAWRPSASGGTPTSECEDGFGRARSLLIPKAFIDLQPERSDDVVLDGERKSPVRSESPQSYDSGFPGFPLLHPTAQGAPGVRIMRTSTSPSDIRHTIRGARPRHSYPLAVRAGTSPGPSVTRPSLVASNGEVQGEACEVLTPLRNVPTVPSNLAIGSWTGSPHGPESPDLSDEDQSSTESSSSLGRP